MRCIPTMSDRHFFILAISKSFSLKSIMFYEIYYFQVENSSQNLDYIKSECLRTVDSKNNSTENK